LKPEAQVLGIINEDDLFINKALSRQVDKLVEYYSASLIFNYRCGLAF